MLRSTWLIGFSCAPAIRNGPLPGLTDGGGDPWPAMDLAIGRGKTGSFHFEVNNVRDLTSPTVDIVLKPDADAARHSLDVTSYWNGEIVFHDIPIQGNSTQPSGG